MQVEDVRSLILATAFVVGLGAIVGVGCVLALGAERVVDRGVSFFERRARARKIPARSESDAVGSRTSPRGADGARVQYEAWDGRKVSA